MVLPLLIPVALLGSTSMLGIGWLGWEQYDLRQKRTQAIIEVRFDQQRQFVVADTLAFEVEVKNIADLKGWTLQIRDDKNAYVSRGIKLKRNALQPIQVEMVNRNPMGGARSLPEQLELSLYNARDRVVKTELVNFPYYLYSKMLESPANEEADILLIGMPGVGKTTFCLTAMTALGNEPGGVAWVNSEQHQVHQTTRITLYDLKDRAVNQKVSLRLWDTWGWVQSKFKMKFLDDLIDGTVTEGYKMQDWISSDYVVQREDAYTTLNVSAPVQKTVVLFFIKIEQIHRRDVLELLKGLIQTLHRYGMIPLVILTWLTKDQVNDVASQENAIQVASRTLDVPTYRVFPFYGYVNNGTTDEVKRHGKVDSNVFEILQAALKSSDQFVVQLKKKREEERKLAEQRAAIKAARNAKTRARQRDKDHVRRKVAAQKQKEQEERALKKQFIFFGTIASFLACACAVWYSFQQQRLDRVRSRQHAE